MISLAWRSDVRHTREGGQIPRVGGESSDWREYTPWSSGRVSSTLRLGVADMACRAASLW